MLIELIQYKEKYHSQVRFIFIVFECVFFFFLEINDAGESANNDMSYFDILKTQKTLLNKIYTCKNVFW